MQTVAHLQYGWLLANIDKNFTTAERRIIAIAAIAPDIDSLAAVFGTDAFYEYHHIVLHNIPTMLLYMGIALIFSRKPNDKK